MAVSALSGPLVVWGQNPPIGSGVAQVPEYNPDLSYSGFALGTGLVDPRQGFENGGSVSEPLAVLIPAGGAYLVLDQAPATLNAAAIAASQNVTNGTALTLAAGGSNGVVKSTAPLLTPSSGNTIPPGTLFLDGLPAVLNLGQNNGVQVLDPRTLLARCVTITGSASGTGGSFIVAGADVYGYPMTQKLTVGAGAVSVTSTKAFKAIYSVTPQFTDAHGYSVGTADVFGLPLRVDEWAFLDITWNNAFITSNAGFTAAVTTTPSQTTGDVRGTYAVQSASNGTNRLQVFADVAPWNANSATGLFGNTQV